MRLGWIDESTRFARRVQLAAEGAGRIVKHGTGSGMCGTDEENPTECGESNDLVSWSL